MRHPGRRLTAHDRRLLDLCHYVGPNDWLLYEYLAVFLDVAHDDPLVDEALAYLGRTRDEPAVTTPATPEALEAFWRDLGRP